MGPDTETGTIHIKKIWQKIIQIQDVSVTKTLAFFLLGQEPVFSLTAGKRFLKKLKILQFYMLFAGYFGEKRRKKHLNERTFSENGFVF